MQTFVEILALFGVSVDAIAFGTNTSITSRLIDTVLVQEAFMTSVGAFVNVNATSLRGSIDGRKHLYVGMTKAQPDPQQKQRQRQQQHHQ